MKPQPASQPLPNPAAEREIAAFFDILDRNRPRCVDPCFMTGMACGSTGEIEQVRHSVRRDAEGRKVYAGFMIMPFQPKLTIFVKNTLAPFFATHYKDKDHVVELTRSDEGLRIGTIICEGICRRIQEVHFIVIDISVPNENVFYELGLAYGIGRPVILVAHHKSGFGKAIAKYLGAPFYSYVDLDPIDMGTAEDKQLSMSFRGSSLIWSQPDPRTAANAANRSKTASVGFVEIRKNSSLGPGQEEEIAIEADEEHDDYGDIKGGRDIRLAFSTHVKSDIGLALSAIEGDDDLRAHLGAQLMEITALKNEPIVQIANKLDFRQFKETVDSSYFLIVRTGRDCHPMSYFWLGYGHALGKNVIPITQMVVDAATGGEGIHDLAFDIRAQRHMTFSHSKPDLLHGQLSRVMKATVKKDFTVWSRKHFWDRFAGTRGEVSLITGALHVEKHMREMVGDWDLRAASELASYLSNQQYRPRIETPIYDPDYAIAPGPGGKDEYITGIPSALTLGNKNCVIIGSPDVNPLTEIVFAKLHKVPPALLFETPQHGGDFMDMYNKAVIVKKKKTVDGSSSIRRAFYMETVDRKGGGGEERGLAGGWIGFNRIHPAGKNEIMRRYKSQHDPQRGDFEIYGHILIARNPFTQPGAESKFVIVLNGVSGPATFALTHVLTGGVNSDFTLYAERKFQPHTESEGILEKLLRAWSQHQNGVQCIVRVKVDEKKSGSNSSIYDWRLIAGWELEQDKIASLD